MQLWALIVDSLRESLDRKIFWVMIAISLLIGTVMICIGLEEDRISFMFGFWEIDTQHFGPISGLRNSRIVGIVIYMLMDMFLGWGGMILILIATAGIFPAMLDHGGIDVVLSKPLSRPRLFIYKYLSTMVFALLQATIFVVMTFLIMGFRWNVWVPSYLLCIPLTVLLFSYVYCISVLVAVKTRSPIAAIILSIGAWIAFALPPMALQTFEYFPSMKQNEQIYRAIKFASWIPPKTAEIPYLAAKWTKAGTSVDIFPDSFYPSSEDERRDLELARQIEEVELQKNPFVSIGSSLLFEAVIVLWAMAIFVRKDY